MDRDAECSALIDELESAVRHARQLRMTHLEYILRIALLEVADVISGGRLIGSRPPRRRRLG